MNHYQLLGVEPSADAEKIRRAYRAMVKRYHPDVAGSTKKSERVFIAIKTAYDVLSDAQSRATYDHSLGLYTRKRSTAGKSLRVILDITARERRNGVWKTIEVRKSRACDLCQRRGYAFQIRCVFCSGTGSVGQQRCIECRGRGRFGSCNLCDRGLVAYVDTYTIEIKPNPESRPYRLAGAGERGRNGGRDGDLYVIVRGAPTYDGGSPGSWPRPPSSSRNRRTRPRQTSRGSSWSARPNSTSGKSGAGRHRKTKRPLNRCWSCGHTWYPRGSDLSACCPRCKSNTTHYDR